MTPRLHVVAAVLQRGERYFIQQRQPGKHMAGLWEFPGGKVERGETAWFALVRELEEELNIKATRGEPLIQLTHDYSDRVISLDVWQVTGWDGEPDAQERQVTGWHSLSEMHAMPLLPADGPVLNAMALPHRILVTPDCTSNMREFLARLESTVCLHQLGMCILRQTRLSGHDYQALAVEAHKILTDLDCKMVVHGLSPSRVNVLDKIDAYGIHVPASAGMALATAPKHCRNWSMSCHSPEELRKAQSLNAHFALLGSVCSTASHPAGSALGWNAFRHLVADANLPVFAIGGMQLEDEVQSRLQGAQGIAAISALWGRGHCNRDKA